jgi:pimeloyl-ACP methyl ester carboxylesterase
MLISLVFCRGIKEFVMPCPDLARKLIPLLLLFVVLPSCASPRRGDLVSSRLRFHLTPQDLTRFAMPGLRSPSYPVDVYEIVYRTVDGTGKLVDASGAVAVPVGASSMPVVSIQHGTVFEKNAVPSQLPAQLLDEGLIFAASGYLAVMPDYVGYGVSSRSFHPYLHAPSLAASVIDMLRAVRPFAAQKRLKTDGRLFLTGYSEGGYATLAAHREIESRHYAEFKVTASAPMAGPYDLLVTMEVLMQRGSPASVPYLAFALWAYDRIYGFDNLRGIVREPYRSRILKMFEDPSPDQISASLPSTAMNLFEPDFIAAWRKDGAKRIKNTAKENSLILWRPKAPVFILHCRHDTVVPVENAIEAHGQFSAQGAGDARLVVRDVGDHGDCFAPLFIKAMSFFESVRTKH